MRAALGAVVLALVLAPAAMAEKHDETIAKDFAAFDKALEGLDPSVREKIDTATLQLLLDTLKLAQTANSTSAATAASLSSTKPTTDDEKPVADDTESTEEEEETSEEAAVLTDDAEEESAEEVEEESAEEVEEEAEEVEEEAEEEVEEEPEEKPATKPKARSGAVAHTSTIAKWQQCGGKGGECSKAGACADAQFSSKCESGTSCKRHSEW